MRAPFWGWEQDPERKRMCTGRQGLAGQVHAAPAAQGGQAGSQKLFQPSHLRPSSCTWERSPRPLGEGGARPELRTDTPQNLESVSSLAPSFIDSGNIYWAPTGGGRAGWGWGPPGTGVGRPCLRAGPLGRARGPCPHPGWGESARPTLGAEPLRLRLSARLGPAGRQPPWTWGPGLLGAERVGGGGSPQPRPGPTHAAVPGMGVLNFFFVVGDMHVVLIIYTQHLSPPNVVSGFGRSQIRERWMDAPGGAGAGRGLDRSCGSREAGLGVP